MVWNRFFLFRILDFIVDGTHWGSYFNNVIKNDWSSEKNDPIKIDRDGKMFRYITEFYHHDELAFKSQKPSLELVRKIQAEAEFFNLSSLVEACETYTVSRVGKHLNNQTITCAYHDDDVDHLVNVLGKVWASYCMKGYETLRDDCTILKSSTLKSINIDELCEIAIPKPSEERNESLVFEIQAEQLNQDLWSHFDVENYKLHKFAPRMKLALRPYKLVICKEGGQLAEHQDFSRGESHIGTLLHILNSKFTGGELVVRQNDTEISIGYPGYWLAMYGEALQRIQPVESGTLVALIFDLHHEGLIPKGEFFSNEKRFEYPIVQGTCARATTEDATRDKFYTALDNELKKYDDVVISLTHLYPMCQVDSTCLRGGDALLYQLLAEREKEYDLCIVPVKVKVSIDEDDPSSNYLSGIVVDLEYEFSRQVTHTDEENGSTLLVIPIHCTSSHVLSYPVYNEHVELEQEVQETIYLVTGFRISKRAAAEEGEPANDSTECVGQKRSVPTDTTDEVVKKLTLC